MISLISKVSTYENVLEQAPQDLRSFCDILSAELWELVASPARSLHVASSSVAQALRKGGVAADMKP